MILVKVQQIHFANPKTMKLKSKYIVGKDYRYSQISEIEKESEEFVVHEYGSEHLGQNAIHIRYHKSEIDIWFIWQGLRRSRHLCLIF